MRVTGGSARGRLLAVPSGTRPMTARMREALFAILDGVIGDLPGGSGSGVRDCSFLDLFAGSGMIAAEAASRGARQITAVERDPRKRRTIQTNLSAFTAAATVITAPAERFIAAAGRRGQSYRVVCMDPPYAYQHRRGLFAALAKASIVEPGGCIIFHCHDRDRMDVQAVPFTMVDSRRYGQSALLLFRP